MGDKSATRKAVDKWYGQKRKNYDSWAPAHNVTIGENKTYHLEKQKEWCQYANITATPTIFINGRRLPDLFQIPDLKYLLEEQA